MKKRQKHLHFFYESIKIQPTYAVSFYRSTNPNRSKKLLPNYNKNKGQISIKAATKIRNSINWMYLFSEPKFVYSKREKTTFSFKLNFITLTLSEQQKHSDSHIKTHLLIPFIEWITKTQKAFMWLWKAESQSNGNIHFHITTHQFIHWKSIRAKWNYLLAKNGYCKCFQDGTNDKGNAATQIKAVLNAKQLGSYMAKYISKHDKWKIKPIRMKLLKPKPNSQPLFCSNIMITSPGSPFKRNIAGRLWACSNNIANINCFTNEFEMLGSELDLLKEDLIDISNGGKKEKYYSMLFYLNSDYKNLPTTIKYQLAQFKPGNKQQTNFTVDSLFT